jgi:hypothetical protein
LQQFRLSVTLGAETFTETADSIVEALTKITTRGLAKAKAVIKVESGKKSAQVFLYPFQTRKLFANKISQVLFQKRMIGALK